jgi:hypothetical protein
MDGLRLAAAVRDRWPPIKIIVVTGHKPPELDELPNDSFGKTLHCSTDDRRGERATVALKEHTSWSGVDCNGNAGELEMIHPSAKKRGADAHVPAKSKQQRPKDLEEQKLVQGLERSMAGSDPVSVSQLVSSNANVNKGNRQRNAC